MKFVHLASVGLALCFAAVVVLPVACSSSNIHPAPVNDDTDGAFSYDARVPVQDAPHDSSDGATDAPTDGPTDASDASDGSDAAPCTGWTDNSLCGGTVCPKCEDTKKCQTGTDCKGGACSMNVCVTPTCTDKVKNGSETDVDCGGGTCPKCTLGKGCMGGTDCASTSCASGACGCPTGMVVVATSAALGGAYCIDQTEVQNGQYNQFLNANQPIAGQVPQCSPAVAGGPPVNPTYVPQGAWPPAQPLSSSLGLPVRYVDWCDAYAYCSWAGKQLCGKIGGGTNDYPVEPDGGPNAKNASAWYNACSAQGVNTYPYDVSVFNAKKCNGSGNNEAVTPQVAYPDGAYQVATWSDQGTFGGQLLNTSCQGGTVNLFQMSGNVAEWEDSCAGAASTDDCRVRGGAYTSADSPTALACTADRSETRLAHKPDVGFRCCAY